MIKKYSLKLSILLGIVTVSSLVAARFTIFAISNGILTVRGLELLSSEGDLVANLVAVNDGAAFELYGSLGQTVRIAAYENSAGLYLYGTPTNLRAMVAVNDRYAFMSLLDESDIQRVRLEYPLSGSRSPSLYFTDPDEYSVLEVGLRKHDIPYLWLRYPDAGQWFTSLTDDGRPFTTFAPLADVTRLRLELNDSLSPTITEFNDDGTPGMELFDRFGTRQ